MTIDILALARECCITPDHHGLCFVGNADDVIEFANAIIERCAVLADAHRAMALRELHDGLIPSVTTGWAAQEFAAESIALHIRSMKAPTP